MSGAGSKGGSAIQVVLGPLAGLASIILGLIVIIGWYIKSESLIQISSQFAPMQYNTALGFILSGLGLLALTRDKETLTRVFGGLASLLGLVTLSQYLFGFNLGLDNLFMDHYMTTRTSHVGRMGPVPAVGFSLFGAALIIYSYRKFRKSFDLIDEFTGMAVVALAGLAYLSYLTDVDAAAGWQDLARMAIHTATGFMVLGVGFLAAVWREEWEKIATVPLWVPVILLFAVLVFDLLTPLGIAAGVAYVPLVFCALWFKGRYVPYGFAALASILVVLGFFTSPDVGAAIERVLINRGLSLLAIWITALAIFAQKRTEVNLTASEKELESRARFQETITNTMVDALIVINQMGIVISVNNAARKLFGYTSEEIVGNNVKMLMQGETRKEHDSYLKNYRKTGHGNIIGIGPREVQGFTKDGDQLDLELAVNASVLEGKKIYVGSLRDLTEKKRILEQSNVELEKFAYVASHDLQEPLRKVQAFGDRMVTQYASVLDERGLDYLNRMRDAANRMQTLVENLLEFSRIASKGQSFVPVDLAQVAREVASDLEIRIQETETLLEIGDLPTIHADPLQMRQLLQNLIANALKYRRKDTSHTVRLKGGIVEDWGSYRNDTPEQFCQILVKDNGIGFEEKYAERIFGIFQRLHGRSEFEGTGVGLAICRKICERHGGTITAEGRPGDGATFIVTLPINHANSEAA
ncbi:MAG: PAS domain S-box protein [Proteobacteria bacterium]|nr:PAS domain S-box protein [Pseudomonadota bacterium]